MELEKAKKRGIDSMVQDARESMPKKLFVRISKMKKIKRALDFDFGGSHKSWPNSSVIDKYLSDCSGQIDYCIQLAEDAFAKENWIEVLNALTVAGHFVYCATQIAKKGNEETKDNASDMQAEK